MYSRVSGSCSQSASTSHADESAQSAYDDRFTETLADVARASSPTARRPYSLASEPPIEEIDWARFRSELRSFYGDDIKHIADNPQEYSDFVSSKADNTTLVARLGATIDDTADSRYFSYQLGDKSVGLLRTQGGFRIKGEQWQKEYFPDRKNISSVVALRVTHPLVANAGDILLEHQLRLDGNRPLIMSKPGLDEGTSRLEQMGFTDVGENQFVLDPKRHPDKWTKNDEGEWQRADKPRLYLQAESDDPVGEGGTDESSGHAYIETDSSGDDPSWYFERLNLGPGQAG